MSDTAPTSARQRGASRPPVTAATIGLTPATIERRAYEKFVARGYVHGYDVDDWYQAERELLAEVVPAPRGAAKPAGTTAAKASTKTDAKKAAAKTSAKTAATTGAKTSAKTSTKASTKTSAKKAAANKTPAEKTPVKKSTATKPTGRSAPKKD